MRTIRFLSVLLMFAFACNSVFSQNVLTSKEKVHQSELNKALKAAGFASSVSNNSVFFKKDNVTYWITLRCPVSMSDVEFTINRGGYKLGADNYNRDFAMLACNEVNRRFPLVKIYCEESRVAVCIQACAKGGKELASLMDSYLKAFDGVKDCFEEEYGKIAGTGENKETQTDVAVDSGDATNAVSAETSETAETAVEAAAPVIETADTPVAVESADDVQADVVANSELTISASSARGISAAGVAGEFGSPIQSFKTDFVQPRIVMSSKSKGLYKIDIKIYDSEGKLMLWNPLTDKEYSYSKEVEVKKKNRSVEYELDQLGYTRGGSLWPAGIYKFEFWNNGAKLYESAVTIL